MKPLSHVELLGRARKRCLGPEGQGHRAVFIGEFTLGRRRVDGLSFALWASRGFTIDGFEVKASRSDWVRELRDPEKADEAFALCTRWHVVANKGVVKPGELPPGWWLLVPHGGGLTVEVEGRLNEDDGPLHRAIVARALGRAVAIEDREAAAQHGRDVSQIRRELEETYRKLGIANEKRLAEMQDAWAEFARIARDEFHVWLRETPEEGVRQVARVLASQQAVRAQLGATPAELRRRADGLLNIAELMTGAAEELEALDGQFEQTPNSGS